MCLIMICQTQYSYSTQVEKWLTKAAAKLGVVDSLSSSDPSKKAHTEKLDSLAEKIFESCKFNLRLIIERCNQEENSNKNQILQLMIQKTRHFILNRTDSNGFFYQITNQNGISSYLIGTIHFATAHMCNNQKMKEILDQASEVITEVGDDPTVFGADPRVPIGRQMRAIDGMVTYMARERSLTITGLETAAWQREACAKLLEHVRKNEDNQCIDEGYARRHLNYLVYEMIGAWQVGDAAEMMLVTDCTLGFSAKKFSADRTKQWVENPQNSLIDKVKMAKLPICIAVGTDHCIGTNGLINFFTTNGLEVKKL